MGLGSAASSLQALQICKVRPHGSSQPVQYGVSQVIKKCQGQARLLMGVVEMVSQRQVCEALMTCHLFLASRFPACFMGPNSYLANQANSCFCIWRIAFCRVHARHPVPAYDVLTFSKPPCSIQLS